MLWFLGGWRVAECQYHRESVAAVETRVAALRLHQRRDGVDVVEAALEIDRDGAVELRRAYNEQTLLQPKDAPPSGNATITL